MNCSYQKECVHQNFDILSAQDILQLMNVQDRKNDQCELFAMRMKHPVNYKLCKINKEIIKKTKINIEYTYIYTIEYHVCTNDKSKSATNDMTKLPHINNFF